MLLCEGNLAEVIARVIASAFGGSEEYWLTEAEKVADGVWYEFYGEDMDFHEFCSVIGEKIYDWQHTPAAKTAYYRSRN
jgi:hypothetical protein